MKSIVNRYEQLSPICASYSCLFRGWKRAIVRFEAFRRLVLLAILEMYFWRTFYETYSTHSDAEMYERRVNERVLENREFHDLCHKEAFGE